MLIINTLQKNKGNIKIFRSKGFSKFFYAFSTWHNQ